MDWDIFENASRVDAVIFIRIKKMRFKDIWIHVDEAKDSRHAIGWLAPLIRGYCCILGSIRAFLCP